MRKLKVLLISILFSFVFILPVQADDFSNYELYAENIDISMVVEENGQIHVKTILDMNFLTPHHGIDVQLPQRYDMKINGQDKRYYFPITDISVEDYEVQMKESRSGVTIRIGSPSFQVSGPNRYEYSYTINSRDLDLNGLQMFYMNLVGDGWSFPIAKTTFRIEFPKEFGDKIFFYPPFSNQEVNYTRNGNVISGEFNEVLNHEALTLEIPLPNDYFTFESTDFTNIALILSAVLTFFIALIFMMFGRDPVVTETVEFTAPEGLSSAEIGYVYRGMSQTKDVVSLIIYWASQGFLIIEELEKDNIKLTKRKDLPDNRPSEERRVFLALFDNRDEVTTNQLNNTFAATVSHAVSAIPKRFTSNPDLNVFNHQASVMKVLMCIIAPLIPSAYFGTLAYANSGNQTDMGLFMMIAYVVFLVITIGGSYLVAYDRVHKQSQRVLNGIILFIIVMVASVVLSSFPPLRVTRKLMTMMILYLIGIFSAANTGKRTELGSRWLGQILGLRRFIEVAEHDRLVALVDETPELFYDILPYAYVLGVTDIWSKKFESIAIAQPDWYVSSSPNFSSYLLWNSLNRSMHTVSSSMVSMPTPTGSSGGGGSFTGGGGGGFSGGGFGGGGGGGW